MRSYIFTSQEKRRLRRWLETGEEDGELLQILVHIRRNMDALTGDVELLTAAARRLREMGRIVGRARMPRGPGSV